jgi:hypothetical protein
MFRAAFLEFQEQIAKPMRDRDITYLLADTRIKQVSLHDHLVLTAGLAVVLVRELRLRTHRVVEICGIDIDDADLLLLTRLCGWLHDIGKAYAGVTEYRWHVQRSVEWTGEWLNQQDIGEPIFSLIVNAVARHHLRDNPQTLLEKAICLADSYASAGDRPELSKANSLREFESAVQATQALEHELFGNDKPVRLLMGDVDAIKVFVYETSKLPEVRGGSEMLRDLEKEMRQLFDKQLAEECLIYCGGGSFLAVVPTSEADRWKREIEQLYRECTKMATITVVASGSLGYTEFGRGLFPHDDVSACNLQGQGVAADLLFSHFEAVSDDRAKRKGFGELVTDLAARLHRTKRTKEYAPFYPTLPIHQRCQSCGKRPVHYWRNPERDELVCEDPITGESLCSICWMKRWKGREEKRSFANEFVKWAKEKRNVEVPLENPYSESRIPRDLDSLSRADLKGRIAFLYADGNNMGDLLQQARTPAEYRHVSEALKKAVEEALFEALAEAIEENELTSTSRPLPFEIVAVGGDDVTVIVPARYGWELTCQLLRRFEGHPEIQRLGKGFKERWGKGIPLTLSAGLVLADVKYPMRSLQSLSEGLLRKAKGLARQTNQSALCHLWLRTPIVSEDVEDILGTLYHRTKRRENELWLTARPFTLEQAEKLTKLASDLQALPASQRRMLAQVLEQGVYTSLNLALYQAQRMQNEKKRAVLEVFKGLGELIDGQDDHFLFWRHSKENVWCTALLDVLELLELGSVRRENDACAS